MSRRTPPRAIGAVCAALCAATVAVAAPNGAVREAGLTADVGERVLGRWRLELDFCVKPDLPDPFPTVTRSLPGDRDGSACTCVPLWPVGVRVCSAPESSSARAGAAAPARVAAPDRARPRAAGR